MTSAGLVALLLYIYPALVTALSAIFLKEHLTRVKIVALPRPFGYSSHFTNKRRW